VMMSEEGLAGAWFSGRWVGGWRVCCCIVCCRYVQHRPGLRCSVATVVRLIPVQVCVHVAGRCLVQWQVGCWRVCCYVVCDTLLTVSVVSHAGRCACVIP
jgi:hypothetical protein